jgi:protein TonB
MKDQPFFNNSGTIEDMIFENRNKAYGAYELNRKCRKYLIIAFAISLIGVSSAVAVPFIKAFKHKANPARIDQGIIVRIGPVGKDNEILPPLPPVSPDYIQQISYQAPLVVEETDEEAGLAIMEDLLQTNSNIPVPVEIGIIVEVKSTGIEEKPEETVLFPEERASFMGGDENAFRLWVMQQITYPKIAIDNQIFGMIRVEFCVNSKGEVCDIFLTRKLDPSVDNEVLRVIRASPLWSPARQGGRPVKQKFTIPVKFQMQ